MRCLPTDVLIPRPPGSFGQSHVSHYLSLYFLHAKVKQVLAGCRLIFMTAVSFYSNENFSQNVKQSLNINVNTVSYCILKQITRAYWLKERTVRLS